MVASFDASDRSGFSLPRLGSGPSFRGTLAGPRPKQPGNCCGALWRRDLYHALYTICGTILADPDLASQDGWQDYLQRYSTWRHQEYHYNPPEALQ